MSKSILSKDIPVANKQASRKIRFSLLLLEVIVALLIVLWIYTGISKLMDYNNFQTQLGRSPFIKPLAELISFTLPPGELLLAVLLIFRRTRKLALYASFGLMLLFAGYIYIMLHFSYDLPCSCGGVLAKLSWEDHLIFNSGYTILALLGVLIIESKVSRTPQSL